MADYDDRLDAHQGRVARLAAKLFPADSALIRAALCHDDGEAAVGDMPNPVKNRLPVKARAALDAMEAAQIAALWGSVPDCNPDRLRLCDKLDAVMWVAHHRADLLASDGWQSNIAEVLYLARATGVLPQVRAVVAPYQVA